jgi:hypothetical protein
MLELSKIYRYWKKKGKKQWNLKCHFQVGGKEK